MVERARWQAGKRASPRVRPAGPVEVVDLPVRCSGPIPTRRQVRGCRRVRCQSWQSGRCTRVRASGRGGSISLCR
eukprot:5167481-Alexandrium_andersonii.AAC.1